VKKMTKKQAVAVALKAEGHKVKEIALRMEIKPKTVDAHLCAAMKRLNCVSWSELMDAYATTRERYVVS
jgi:DNA-binding NarL/FixJ family response regulator